MNEIRNPASDIGVIETDNVLWDGLDSFCSCLRSMQLNLPLSQQMNDTAENVVIGVFCVCVCLSLWVFTSSDPVTPSS